ncbi:MAG: hypothetical protein RBS19_03435 [Bacteroidales bacterium]|nr:hypothetical protein [Bacteroidales bacterium]MDY0215991.1 hypothetical protein [Bacteroidales bacterium]
MKKTILTFLILLFFLSCNKKDDNNVDKNSTLNSFISLTAENDTIFTGQSTAITAVVDGDKVTYAWSATAGDILGSGSKINYVAPTCTPGNNEVKCTVSASNKTESKTIIITVL